MKAIVVVFIPTQDGRLEREQAAAGRDPNIFWRGSGEDETQAGSRQTSSRSQTTPPFWTWFIENPRSCGV